MPLKPAFVAKSISFGHNFLRVLWGDGARSLYPASWLRVSVRDSAYFEPNSLLYRPEHIEFAAKQLPLVDAKLRDDGGAVQLSWNDHATEYDASWLRAQDGGEASVAVKPPSERVLWDGSARIPTFNYAERETRKLEWMTALKNYGLVYIEDTPTTREGLLDVLHLIGVVKQRYHPDDVYVVESLRKEIRAKVDFSYGGDYLNPHTDTSTYLPPTRLDCFLGQIYDAPVRDTTNFFVDGYRVMADMRREHPGAFDVLTSVPARGGRRRLTVEEDCTPEELKRYHWDTLIESPYVVLNDDGSVKWVQFAWTKRAGFSFWKYDDETLARHNVAYELLHRMMRDERYHARVVFRPGVLAIFDNWRLTHGRHGVHPTTRRRMLGAFMSEDIWRSRWRLIHAEQSGLEGKWLYGCTDEALEILAGRNE
ncbi:gamma-butyrobetaine dioxygenase-like [Oscarella lobularis]|uniref:gamma-butyrobetaine dioxygenase-like n=1 Tax=Oscarella lobularis TaxID=121494 RepID=UPI003313EA57